MTPNAAWKERKSKMPIMSVRLDESSLAKIKDLAGREHKDQSTMARELIAQGWDYLMIRRYKEGRLSLGTLSNELGRPSARRSTCLRT